MTHPDTWPYNREGPAPVAAPAQQQPPPVKAGMTPDEHAAEAQRLLDLQARTAGDPIRRALVHALLATRPTPLSMEEAAARVDAWRAAYPTPPAELTDGPTRPTIIDYDAALDRATWALWGEANKNSGVTPGEARQLAKAAIDAFADTPTTET